jgi:hypothetical protein
MGALMSIPARSRRSRIAHFRTPFLLSVAAPAALGVACGGNADDIDGPEQTSSLAQAGAGGEAPSAACPAAAADVGTSCLDFVGGLTCEYEFCFSSAPMRRCSESTRRWEDIEVPSCNPPAPGLDGCPFELPVPGSDCVTAEQPDCAYPGSCEGSSTAVCRSGQWLVAYSSGPACNPPAVVPVCPERELVAGEGCAYEGQTCSRDACESDAGTHPGHVCTSGLWQEVAAISCAPPDDAPY